MPERSGWYRTESACQQMLAATEESLSPKADCTVALCLIVNRRMPNGIYCGVVGGGVADSSSYQIS